MSKRIDFQKYNIVWKEKMAKKVGLLKNALVI